MRNSNNNIETRTKELLRLETFSDGVFAIAITLLILELIQSVHPEGKEDLLRMLLQSWQSFLAFIIGFLTILVCWINHHLVISYVNRIDTKMFWLNGFVLLIVTFTPFPTFILSKYLDKEGHIAIAIFGINYLMMSVAAYCISCYVYKKYVRLKDKELFQHHRLLYRYSIFYNSINLIMCFISIPVALFFYSLMFLVFAFPKEFSQRLLNQKLKRNIRKSKLKIHVLRA